MPWLGFFHKISQAETFIILDSVQYSKNYFQNRNKIRTANGWCWLTVPVKNNFGTLIKDIQIDNTDRRWQKKYWDSIYFSYKKAPFFADYAPSLESLCKKERDCLSELNICLILELLKSLRLAPKIIKASELKARGKGGDLILNICRELKADVYISGISGKEYLDAKQFQTSNIELVFQEFHHPIYKQLYESFIPCMSIIDLLFNHGPNSLNIINGVGVPVMEEVFL